MKEKHSLVTLTEVVDSRNKNRANFELGKMYSNGGLKSTLDWETTQRLLKEQMSKN